MSDVFTITVLHVPTGRTGVCKVMPREDALQAVANWVLETIRYFDATLEEFVVYKDTSRTTPHSIAVVAELHKILEEMGVHE